MASQREDLKLSLQCGVKAEMRRNAGGRKNFLGPAKTMGKTVSLFDSGKRASQYIRIVT